MTENYFHQTGAFLDAVAHDTAQDIQGINDTSSARLYWTIMPWRVAIDQAPVAQNS